MQGAMSKNGCNGLAQQNREKLGRLTLNNRNGAVKPPYSVFGS